MMRPKAIKGVRTYPDGREVCEQSPKGREEYHRRLRVMVTRQLNRCAMCHKPMFVPEFDHEAGRGKNSAHRDDRIWDGDKPKNAALCGRCNLLKASRRFTWHEGAYVPVSEVA